MNFKIPAFVVLAVALSVSYAPLFAHHGTGVAYDMQKMVTVKGVVTEWIWANPHCGLLLDATDENGNVVHWGVEMGNPHQESGAGFSKDTFKPGDKVTVSGRPAKSGAPRMTGSRFVFDDGRTLPEKHTKGNGDAEPDSQY